MNENIRNKILDSIKNKGCFVFHPKIWEEYGETVTSMINSEEIISIYNKTNGNSDLMNSGYYYVFPDKTP